MESLESAISTKNSTTKLLGTVLLQNQYTLVYDVGFDTGLTIVTSSTDDITVSYS